MNTLFKNALVVWGTFTLVDCTCMPAAVATGMSDGMTVAIGNLLMAPFAIALGLTLAGVVRGNVITLLKCSLVVWITSTVIAFAVFIPLSIAIAVAGSAAGLNEDILIPILMMSCVGINFYAIAIGLRFLGIVTRPKTSLVAGC